MAAAEPRRVRHSRWAPSTELKLDRIRFPFQSHPMSGSRKFERGFGPHGIRTP